MKERKYIQVTTTTELIPIQTVTEYTVPEYFTDEDCEEFIAINTPKGKLISRQIKENEK